MQNKYNSYFKTNTDDNCYDKTIIKEVKEAFNQYKHDYFDDERLSDELFIADNTVCHLIKEMNKSNAIGYDGLSMNMVKNGSYEIYPLVSMLLNLILKHNIYPDNFNTCIIVPIKKNKKLKNFDSNNYRPLSISNCFAQLFEAAILNKSKEINNVSDNQFGFRNKLSTMHPLFIVNELGKKSMNQHTPLYLCKLDAEKAFDHLWRDGLFHKLMRCMDKKLWCLLKTYYDLSLGFLKLNNKIFYNCPIFINRGVKQGGILSPSLFNFYIDDLIKDIIGTNLGYKIDIHLLNIIVYADDIMLIANNLAAMQKLLHICEAFSNNWYIKFNPDKCHIMQTGYKLYKNSQINLTLNNIKIKVVDEFTYLGLNINANLDYNEIFIEKYIKTEKSFYSLYNFGIKRNGLHPFTKAHIYKSYSLPKTTYAIGLVYLNNNTIKKINMRQNNLIKNMVGINYKCHSSPLNRILKIEKFEMIYYKFMCSTIGLVKRSPISKAILEEQLRQNENDLHKEAFINCIKRCSDSINQSVENIVNNHNEIKNIIKTENIIQDTEMDKRVLNLVTNYNFKNITDLNNYLYYNTNITNSLNLD